MLNLLQATPSLMLKDVTAAVRFYVQVLGFRAVHEDSGYAYVERDGAAVRLMKASPEDDGSDENVTYGACAFLFYVDVKEVDGLVAEISPKLAAAGLPTGRGPKDQTWGQREWWVTGPEGGYIVFGQGIQR